LFAEWKIIKVVLKNISRESFQLKSLFALWKIYSFVDEKKHIGEDKERRDTKELYNFGEHTWRIWKQQQQDRER
jgi:hypothetical protein